MNRNRIFRLLVCLILVCCLLIQVSPIRAEAVAVVDDLAIGYAAVLILMACGVVFVTETADEVIAIGNSMTNSLREWGKATGKESQVELWIAGITLFDGDPSNDGSGEQRVKMARGLLAGIAAWVCSVVLATTDIETEGEEAPVGYAYYNGVLLPSLDSVNVSYGDSSRFCILFSPYKNNYVLYASNAPSIYYNDDSGELYIGGSDTELTFYSYIATDSYWKKSSTNTGVSIISSCSWYWIDTDSDPVDYLTTILYPETYVGDIPQKIQDGELDEETLIIPDINYAPLLQPDLTLEESLHNTMQQLKDGTLTYDDFMEQIKVEEETEPDPDPSEDPSEDPTTNVDGDTWTPPTDPNAFALDLSNYFPFCIPFDLYDFLSCLNADPVAPVLEWQVPLPGGNTYPIEIDLSIFDPVAKILRTMQLLLFCIGLAFKTRDLIKG